jgi:hypothetical protein
MGADLYIHSLNIKCKEKYQPSFERACIARDKANMKGDTALANKFQERVSKYYDLLYSRGYFRDSYNGTCLLNLLGLSWWQDICYVQGKKNYITKKGFMPPRNALALRKRIEAIPVPTITLKWLREKNCSTSEGTEVWQKYFEGKKVEFLKFLDTAIKLKEPIGCSC